MANINTRNGPGDKDITECPKLNPKSPVPFVYVLLESGERERERESLHESLCSSKMESEPRKTSASRRRGRKEIFSRAC